MSQVIGEIRAVKPRTSKMFAILEPTILPMEIPAEPFKADFMLTTNSGADVPNATIVKPMMIVGMCNLLAIATAPFTIYSAPPINKIKPAIIKKIEFNILPRIKIFAFCIILR